MKTKHTLLLGIGCCLLYSLFSCQEHQSVPATNLIGYQNSICKENEVRGPVHTMQVYRAMGSNDAPMDDKSGILMIFNRQGYLVDIQHRTANSQWNSICTYDSVQRIFTDHSVDVNGTAISTVVSYYDAAGNTVCFKSYQSGVATQQPAYMERYEYDKNNNLVKRNYYSDGQHLTNTISYEFNQLNQQVKSVDDENRMRENEYTTYVYDKAGNLTAENTFVNGSIHHINQFEYDSHGNATEVKSIYPDKNLTRTTRQTYEYDQHGNWVVQKGENDEKTPLSAGASLLIIECA